MISGINHITLSVSDIERSFLFYTELLGLTPLCKWPRGAYLLAGNDWFCLHVPEKTFRVDISGYTHYAFSVSHEDFLSLINKLSRAGVTPFKDNRSEGDSYYFCDPDGHKLELHVGDWRTRFRAKKLAPWPETQFFV